MELVGLEFGGPELWHCSENSGSQVKRRWLLDPQHLQIPRATSEAEVVLKGAVDKYNALTIPWTQDDVTLFAILLSL